MMERKDVYKLIDGEREYQDARWGRTVVGADKQLTGSSTLGQGVGNRSVDEFSLYIYGYAQDLLQSASHQNNPLLKLDIVRKITALGVACMEQHDTRPRNMT